jgi:predicted cupin superfamily sugar epimerase
MAPLHMINADEIIAHFELEPHPEGGWFRQTWQGPVVDARASGTAILFLLTAQQSSHWHKVDADEIWLWHCGAPLVLSVGEPDGFARDMLLGPDMFNGQSPQIIVPRRMWQAAKTSQDWTLVSCTVSPGFQFSGFELAPPGFDIERRR